MARVFIWAKQNVFEFAAYIGVAVGIIGVYIGYFFLHVISADMFKSILAGVAAQLVDGALGMAYGVTAGTFLLNSGISPAAASASIHTSEIFTSGISGFMHLKFGNVNKKLLETLVLPGMIGAVLGSVSISFLESIIKPIITPIVSSYTLVLGLLILKKAFGKKTKRKKLTNVGWLATFGGFMDAVGGGGWGPIVTSTIIAKGRSPILTIGSVNLAEFFVSVASAFTFVFFIGLTHIEITGGLILGGVIAAPIAARIFKHIPIKPMMIMVSTLVIGLSLRQIIKLFL